MFKIILNAISLGVGVGAVVLMIMSGIKERDAIILLGIGLSCLALNSFPNNKDKK